MRSDAIVPILVVLVLVGVGGSSTRAIAGPPRESHLSWRGFAPTETGLWLVGFDNCDEAGRLPIAVRLDGKQREVERSRDQVNVLARSVVAAKRWREGREVYEAGEHAHVSHDGGRTWTKLAGIAESLDAVIGADDRVFGLVWNRLLVTTDRGKKWQESVDLLSLTRRCPGGGG